jgi:hypothetical protein
VSGCKFFRSRETGRRENAYTQNQQDWKPNPPWSRMRDEFGQIQRHYCTENVTYQYIWYEVPQIENWACEELGSG